MGPYVLLLNPVLNESGIIHRPYDGPESWMTVLQRLRTIEGIVDIHYTKEVKRLGLASV